MAKDWAADEDLSREEVLARFRAQPTETTVGQSMGIVITPGTSAVFTDVVASQGIRISSAGDTLITHQ